MQAKDLVLARAVVVVEDDENNIFVSTTLLTLKSLCQQGQGRSTSHNVH